MRAKRLTRSARGTTLPSRDDKLRGTEPPELEPNPQYTVLVVEDEAPVRLAVVEYLRDRDFQVLEAANGVEAVNILSADTAVDVVCSHVQMAGDLDGFALARWVRVNKPNIRTLLTSGYAGDVANQIDASADASQPDEPYNCENLLRHIRRLLAEQSCSLN